MRLYDFLPSGNGYKVRLLLSQLGVRFTLVEKEIFAGETRTPEFLAINPNGRIPVLELDDGRRLALPARGPVRPRAGPAVDVLRAVQPRAVHRGRAPPASHGPETRAAGPD